MKYLKPFISEINVNSVRHLLIKSLHDNQYA